MKYLLATIILSVCFTEAEAVNCPIQPHDYMADILPIRAQEKILDAQIDNAAETTTAVRYVRQEQVLDDRISKILKTMNESDAIGQSILKDVKD